MIIISPSLLKKMTMLEMSEASLNHAGDVVQGGHTVRNTHPVTSAETEVS